MKKIITLLSLSFGIFMSSFLNAQITNGEDVYIPGTICREPDCSDIDQQALKTNSPQNGNGSIATTYTVTACGLGFVTASVRLNKRNFGCCGTGANQPAPITVSGLPACFTATNLVKAFLYCGVSGNGIGITASVTNTASVTQSFPMTMIGSHTDKCWGYVGTYNYRADVSSVINGNGSYTLSGFPSVVGTNDTDGAILFIIYTDPTQTYRGSFVIADGCIEGSGALSTTISGFNVCGTPTNPRNFMVVTDLQKIANVPFKMNSAVDNFTWTTASQNVWDYVSTNVTIPTTGQTSATFGLTTSGDCWNVVVAGMAWRTTNCAACTAGTCVLPIELTSFDAVCSNEGVNLNWKTSSERNNASFSIMRSEDVNNYSTVGIVTGSGNSNSVKQYSYLDKTAETGKTYYYKLKQTDIDRTENEVGEIVHTNCGKKNYQLDVFPNPSSTEVFVVSETDLFNVNIVISDGFGQKVKTINNVNLTKNEKYTIDVRDIINGCYHLTISDKETIIKKKIATFR